MKIIKETIPAEEDRKISETADSKHTIKDPAFLKIPVPALQQDQITDHVKNIETQYKNKIEEIKRNREGTLKMKIATNELPNGFREQIIFCHKEQLLWREQFHESIIIRIVEPKDDERFFKNREYSTHESTRRIEVYDTETEKLKYYILQEVSPEDKKEHATNIRTQRVFVPEIAMPIQQKIFFLKEEEGKMVRHGRFQAQDLNKGRKVSLKYVSISSPPNLTGNETQQVIYKVGNAGVEEFDFTQSLNEILESQSHSCGPTVSMGTKVGSFDRFKVQRTFEDDFFGTV